MLVKVYDSALDESTVQAINSFLVEAGVGTTFFQSPVYYKSCFDSSKTQPLYFVAYSENRILGILLVVRQVQIDFPLLSFFSSRDLIIGGPQVRKGLLDVYTALFDQYLSHRYLPVYTEVRNLTDVHDKKDTFITAGFAFEDHLNIEMNLNQSEEQLWKEMDATRRKQINRSSREGCFVVEDTSKEALSASYVILQQVYTRAQLPLPSLSFFMSILHHSDSNFGLKIFVAKLNNTIVGCRLCILSNSTLYDYYAGSLQQYYNKYPNDLLPWEAMKWGKSMGCTVFDFGGAGKPNVPYGVRDYKLKFGGELVNYGRFVRINHSLTYRLSAFAFTILRPYIK